MPSISGFHHEGASYGTAAIGKNLIDLTGSTPQFHANKLTIFPSLIWLLTTLQK
jgi:hypothetical protein